MIYPWVFSKHTLAYHKPGCGARTILPNFRFWQYGYPFLSAFWFSTPAEGGKALKRKRPSSAGAYVFMKRAPLPLCVPYSGIAPRPRQRLAGRRDRPAVSESERPDEPCVSSGFAVEKSGRPGQTAPCQTPSAGRGRNNLPISPDFLDKGAKNCYPEQE